MSRLSDRTLKLPAASCREVISYSHHPRTQQQATGNALAPGFKTVLYGIAITVSWLLITVNYLLSVSH
jgi:hypothetical protein